MKRLASRSRGDSGLAPPLLLQQDQVGGVEVLTGLTTHHPVAE
jgi:hypothetical protein